MAIASYIAASRQVALQQALDNAAMNIASQGVPGHQETELIFNTYVKNGVSYANDPVTVRSQSAGSVIQTQDPLHVALNRPGYFAVETKESGVGYTRAGTFQLNAERFLVTPQGDLVLDDGASPIQIPETSTNILISEDGTIADQQAQIARLGVFTFDNFNDMSPSAQGYLTTAQTPQPVDFPDITQGAYEGSNTNMILATTQLAALQRDYQQNMKTIETESDMESQSTQRLVKTASGA